DLAAQHDAAGRRRVRGHSQHDLSTLRELDGVSEEVDEHLTDPQRIARHEPRYLAADEADELEVLRLRLLREQHERLLGDGADVEVDVLDVETPRFDLREVEDVVDDLEERRGRVA